ncbi:MAG: GNAT family N-acetyltransferase [Acetobacteraceae bacterium]|nr:GNAT family N-acetyltransferase [Acetobacteraceae bacterium]
MIAMRRARPGDAVGIAAVHVAAWRSAYPGILPNEYLARLSVPRQAAHYDQAIRSRAGVFVAVASGIDVPADERPRVVGFATAAPVFMTDPVLADGEIGTLYVLDDYRERGQGRRLIRAAGSYLAEAGCQSAFLWVLRDNPSRWFYQRLGGRPVAEAEIRVAGRAVMQMAFVWDPIERLLTESTSAA